MRPQDHIAVLVTRGNDAALEILVYEVASGVDVIRGPALADEHPTEGAFRLATAMSGFDVYFTFRKLTQTPRPEGLAYVYQTSPEVDLPARFEHASITSEDPILRRFLWLQERDAPARLPEDLRPALARLRRDRG